MSWANQIHKKRSEELNTQRSIKKLLAKLQEDETYQAMQDEIAHQVWEEEKESIRQQIQTVMWCSLRVAMQDEKISDSKANRILALADSYTGYDMTAEEFRQWCLDKTGLDIRVDE